MIRKNKKFIDPRYFMDEKTSRDALFISIEEVVPGGSISDDQLEQEIEIDITDNSGDQIPVTITLRQLIKAARADPQIS